MTLLELLKQELKEWPEWCVCMTQDDDRIITLWDHDNIRLKDEKFLGKFWDEPLPAEGGTGLSVDLNENLEYAQILAHDYETAIITKEMWEDD